MRFTYTQFSFADPFPDVVEMDFINLPRAGRRLVPVQALADTRTVNACYHKGRSYSARHVTALTIIEMAER